MFAENLLVYPPEHVIYGDYAYEVWDDEMIKYLLEFFNPGNMRVDILTKSLKNSPGNGIHLMCILMLCQFYVYVLHITYKWLCIFIHMNVYGYSRNLIDKVYMVYLWL